MKTPDIEIYVKNASSEQILNWLGKHFDSVEIALLPDSLSQKQSIAGKLLSKSVSIPVVVTPNAAGKSFCSLWFKSPETGWQNDEACALSLLEMYDLEARCAASGWEENEDESGEYWLSISRNEKKLIRWG